MTNDTYGDGYYYGASMYGALSAVRPFTPDPVWDHNLKEYRIPGVVGARAL